MILKCKMSYYSDGHLLSYFACPFTENKPIKIGVNSDECKKCKYYKLKIPFLNYIICRKKDWYTRR
jgi:hypothetical protein